MKIYQLWIVSILLLILFVGCKNDQLNFPEDIHLNIKGEVSPDSIRLMNFGQTEVHVIKEGNPFKINLNRSLNDVFNIDLFVDGKSYWQQVYLDGEKVLLEGQIKDNKFVIDTVYGSQVYNNFKAYSAKISKLLENKTEDSVVNTYLLKEIKQNLTNPLSFWMSDQYIGINKNDKDNITTLKNILLQQPDSLKEHPLSMHGKIDGILNFSKLDLASNEYYNLENEITKIDLSHKGDYLLDFWFVNCPPCLKDHKAFERNMGLLKSKEVEMIGISIDWSYDDWKNYLDKHNYKWQNYRQIGRENDITKQMDIWAFPTYLLLSNDGEIRARFNSFTEIENYYQAKK